MDQIEKMDKIGESNKIDNIYEINEVYKIDKKPTKFTKLTKIERHGITHDKAVFSGNWPPNQLKIKWPNPHRPRPLKPKR